MNENITIVEYNEKYAGGIADMWNASAEGWEGDQWNQTASLVKSSEVSSAHKNFILL